MVFPVPHDGKAPISALIRRVRTGAGADHEIDLLLGDCHLRIRLNSRHLALRLDRYFEPFINPDPPSCPDITLTALEMAVPDLGLDFIDWPREHGKVGRKDSFLDLADGRACRKVHTAMQYLMTEDQLLIFGPCLENDNQVINFIVSQYISWLLNRGWALCHASAIVRNGHGVAFAAFSGGGKSTLALALMPEGFDFVSNDRLLIGPPNGGAARMLGVPKQPRINPGTVLNNPALSSVIGAKRRAELATMTTPDLWRLEEKYDAPIGSLFGPERLRLEAPLETLLILNWKLDGDQDTSFAPVSLHDRPELLAAVMKSPGPFHNKVGHSKAGGGFCMPEDSPDVGAYLSVFNNIRVFEATGKLDFPAARDFVLEKIRD